MADQTLSLTQSRLWPLPALIAAGSGVLLVAVAPRLLGDPDTYSHIALGRWMLAHLTVPAVDPLSQTMRGAHWIAFEWLSQILFAAAFSAWHWKGVVLLPILSIGLSLGIIAHTLLRRWRSVPVLIATMSTLVLLAPHLLARPHALAMPLMATWFAILIRANDEGRPPPLWLAFLMAIWANLHGSFIFGLAMLAPLALEAVWTAAPEARLRLAKRWAIFGFAALAAACLTPYGPGMIIAIWRTIALGQALTVIAEWRPQDFSHIAPFELILLGTFAGALYAGVRLPLFRLLMILGLLHLSLSQIRHADLLALLVPLLIARPLAEQFATLAADRDEPGPRLFLGALGAALTVTLAVALRPDVAPLRSITPRAAAAAMGADPGAVLNDYAFGGYLDFVGIAPFIDGRGELYGAPYLLRYQRALDLQDIGDLEKLVDAYGIRTTLLSPRTPAVSLLDRLPGWHRVYADEIAVVHRRDEATSR